MTPSTDGSMPTLWIVGTPLDEDGELTAPARTALARAAVVVGESRGITMRFVKQALGVKDLPPSPGKEIFLLDPPRPEEWEAAKEALTRLARTGGEAALLSDTGMPILFDPGAQVLAFCRDAGFAVRSAPSATSWGTACALSGFPAPFHVVGFPPRDTALRRAFFQSLRALEPAIVLMDTPYRFTLSLKEATEAFGGTREAFLGWELSKPGERLLWGPLSRLAKEALRLGLEKGEFVLVVAGNTSQRGQPSRRSAHSSSRSGES